NTILLEAAAAASSDSDDDASTDSGDVSGLSPAQDAFCLRNGEADAQDSVAIDIGSSSNINKNDSPFTVVISHPAASTASAAAAAASSSSSRRQHRRQQAKHRPPQYQMNDPIAAQLLEAGSTSLEPVVSYRNKQTSTLDLQTANPTMDRVSESGSPTEP
ncbi:hypothetical protein IWW45_007873, partial [Coemansia sp. RSA 485]